MGDQSRVDSVEESVQMSCAQLGRLTVVLGVEDDPAGY